MLSKAKIIPRMTEEEKDEVAARLTECLTSLGGLAAACLDASGVKRRDVQHNAIDGFFVTSMAILGRGLAKVASIGEIGVEPGADDQIKDVVNGSIEAALDNLFPEL